MNHASQRRPYTSEHPLLRTVFLTSCGERHQSTMNSTYRNPIYSGSGDQDQAACAQAQAEFRRVMQGAVEVYYKTIGCTLLSLELVSSMALELEL